MKKKIYNIVLLFLFLGACSSSSFTSEEENFPLKQSLAFTSSEDIYSIGASNNVLIFSTFGTVQSVDTPTFETIWKIDNFLLNSEIAFTDGYTVLMSNEEVLLISDKTEIRRLNLSEKRKNNIELTAIGNYIYVVRGGFWDLEVYDILENKMIWDVKVGRGGADIYYEPSLDIVYVVTYSAVSAFQNSTGNLLWEREIKVDFSAYANGMLFLVKDDSVSRKYTILTLDTSTGGEVWRSEYKYSLPIYVEGIGIFQDTLILNAHYLLVAFDASNGLYKWETSENNAVFYTKPVLLRENLYIKGSNKKVYAVSLNDGEIIGSVQLEPYMNIGLMPGYEADSGIYLYRDGIVFKTRDSIVYYAEE